MSSITTVYARTPTLLTSQGNLRNITQSSGELQLLQQQMSTAKRVIKPSDDAIAAALVSAFDREIETATRIQENQTNAVGVMNTIDNSLQQVTDVVIQAQTIASEQIGITSDTATRAQQASLVDSLIQKLVTELNQDYNGLSLYAGGRTNTPAVESFLSGYRYLGDQSGLYTDIGKEIDFPITLSADQVTGSLSSRVEGSVDLNPILTNDTKITDLRGPALGNLPLGTMEATVTVGGTPHLVSIDLAGADTVEEVATRITTAISNDPLAAPALTGNVTFTNTQLSVPVAAGDSIVFDNGPVGTTATALGLAGDTYTNANATNSLANTGLDPRITNRTTLGDMNPGTALAYGDIQIRNGVKTATLTVNAGMSIEEMKNAVDALDIGVRLEIDGSGQTLNFVNEVAGSRMSIGEVGGGVVATNLGLRSMKADTLISTFNDGNGVEIADGAIDPITGLPDPAKNVDFDVVLSDGSTFTVDFVPGDMTDVQSVIARINADAAAVAIPIGTGPGQFTAQLTADGNGIELTDQLGGPDPITIVRRNGYAAEDLGLFNPQTSTVGPPARLVAEDRADVRVDSLLSTLIDLRDSLLTDDVRGIGIAGDRLAQDFERVTQTRALLGGRTQRVEDARTRSEDRVLLDSTVKAELQELDFFEATTRFAALETQLNAALQVTARLSQLSLINLI